MKPLDTPFTSRTFLSPLDGFADIPVWSQQVNGHDPKLVSFWQPDMMERAMIAAGAPVALIIVGDQSRHPISSVEVAPAFCPRCTKPMALDEDEGVLGYHFACSCRQPNNQPVPNLEIPDIA